MQLPLSAWKIHPSNLNSCTTGQVSTVTIDNFRFLILARRSTGYFDVRRLDGRVFLQALTIKKLRLLQKRKNSR